MKKIYLMITGAALMLASCNENVKEKEVAIETETIAQAEIVEEEPVQSNTIVDVAVGNENFSTLVTAVKAAGLAQTLGSTGPFTVFAPTNDAFDKLPEGTVATLIAPENKAKLTDILTYHVVSGKYMASDVVAGIKKNNGKFTTNTVMGEPITLMMDGANVVIKDAKGGKSVIIMKDVSASNGVIHAIDSVIMPKS
ncbi:fasciclin domain-containing protein [Dokdonia sp. Hel_I_53]|uniref:fasciclin domain-containing protein n=1 Tax=Dokdonia sp. Hel_I_53 TaxID=1566287 RepID=UPI00119ABB37|nr:fasciclin domain-containing protein [Dokdonia sp. Hel_I_53]TVZ51167.1 putative surface protein with fasciclin (FAS1) repeats [Dokdonia sp. Hel_I_53]